MKCKICNKEIAKKQWNPTMCVHCRNLHDRLLLDISRYKKSNNKEKLQQKEDELKNLLQNNKKSILNN